MRAFAVSNKPGEITLTGFYFIKDMLPHDFEVCLIIEKNGHLSAGCWDTGLWSEAIMMIFEICDISRCMMRFVTIRKSEIHLTEKM